MDSNQQNYWNNRSKSYTAFFEFGRVSRTTAISKLCSYFNFNKLQTILELGSGNGALTEELIQRINSKTMIYSCDISDQMLYLALKRLGPKSFVSYINCSADEFPTNLKPDLIISSFLLHHLTEEQKKSVIKRAYHSLPAGGSFCFVDEILANNDESIECHRILTKQTFYNDLSAKDFETSFDSTRENPVSKDCYLELLNAAGFKQISYERVSDIIGIFTAKKE